MKIALRILALSAGLSVAAIAAPPMMGMVMNGIQDQDQGTRGSPLHQTTLQ